MDNYKAEKRKVVRYISQSKKEINEQKFGRKMNQDVDENYKLL